MRALDEYYDKHHPELIGLRKQVRFERITYIVAAFVVVVVVVFIVKLSF